MNTPCHYAIVRFLPFVETGEFANIGIVVFEPKSRFFSFKLVDNKTKRVTQFFDELDTKVLRQSIKNLSQELTRMQTIVRDVGSQQIWQEVIKPKGSLIQFGESRAVMTQNPKVTLETLFGRYVQRDFATKEYQEEMLVRDVRERLSAANLERKFKEEKIGAEHDYHVTFPFVAKLLDQGSTITKIIKPLVLDNSDVNRVIEHGGSWINRIRALKKRGLLVPAHVLIPTKGQSDIHTNVGRAYSEITDELKGLGVQLISHDDDRNLLAFAQ